MEEQYTSYTAIQLAADPAFIRWVQAGHEDAGWQKWIESHPEAREKADRAKQIILDVNRANVYLLNEADKKAMWENIAAQSTRIAPASSNRFRIIARWSIAVAAAVAYLFWLSTWNTPTTIQAYTGEQQEFDLPENSTVLLNAGTSVSYHEKNFNAERIIRLDGEAFFRVQPGSQFTVVTDQGNVTVLGTSFNVIARKDRFEVSCYTGKVMVENKAKAQQTLTPGMRCTTNTKTQKLDHVSFAAETGVPEWTTGKFVFNNQPLHIVVEELERQYNINVKLEPGLENMAYTGLFESGDLEKALSLITWPLHLKADIKNNTVSIVR